MDTLNKPADDSADSPKASRPPTPQQMAAIDTRHVSVVLSAGAGCGKTWVLTRRFLSHLQPGPGSAELPSLVAITFTERAAREMRERIRSQCSARLTSAPTDEEDHWMAIVRELDSARVSTIHSFCSSLLRSHAVEAGLDPRFGLLDETLGPSFLRQAVKSGMHDRLAADDPDVAELVFEYGLNRAQYLLSILVQERYRIDFAKWEQFTARKLAQHWDTTWHQEFVPRLLMELGESESACQIIELLREDVSRHPVMQARRLSLLELIPQLAEGRDPENLLRLLIENARIQGGGTKNDWDNEQVYADVKDAFDAFRKRIKTLQGQLEYDPNNLMRGAEIGLCALRAAENIGKVYDRRKAEGALVDFDDLLLLARNLLRDHDEVRERMADGLSLLMVDEFQDTDPIQNDIVQMLCGAALHTGRLFVVGDTKQSIYRFRRAMPGIFQDLSKAVPPAGRLPLSVNFRSQPQVLAFVNAVFDGALGDQYEALEADADQLSTEPCIEFLFSVAGAGEANAGEEDESQTDHSVTDRRRREADWIARRVTQLLTDTVARVRERIGQTDDFRLRHAKRGDIVILFRAMTDVRYYEEALRNYGIDYYVVGGRAFFAQQEVFDLVNLCQYLDDIDNEAALVGVLRSPFFSLSDDAIFALGSSPTAALSHSPPAHLSEEQQTRVAFAAKVLCELRAQKDLLPIARLLTLAIDRTGYDASLLSEYLGARKLANLRKLLDMARQFDQSGLFTLSDFVDNLGEAVQEETREAVAATHSESSDVVQLMSIHQSKGLEFPVVIVADMDRNEKHHAPAAHCDSELGPLLTLPDKFGVARGYPALEMHRISERVECLAETRRLFYVAATRAADLLILSANLKQAGQAMNPWLQLVAERFYLDKGQPRTEPTNGGTSIRVKYGSQLPDIFVHQSAPTAVDLTETGPQPPPLGRFRELLDQALPDPLPEMLRTIPADRSARRRFSVSEIEMADRQIQENSSERSRPVRGARPKSPPAAAEDAAAAGGNLSATAQLGTLVHSLFERIDFKTPQEIARLINACCGSFEMHIDKRAQEIAAECVKNLLDSPLRAELAAARQMHREIDFRLPFAAARQTGRGKGAPRADARPDAESEGFVIGGTIDCLFESADGAWSIVDYKTGLCNRSSADYLADYEIQLGLYALAVEQLLGRLPDRVELVFMRQEVKRVVFEPTRARLAGITHRVEQALAFCASQTFEAVVSDSF